MNKITIFYLKQCEKSHDIQTEVSNMLPGQRANECFCDRQTLLHLATFCKIQVGVLRFKPAVTML